MKIVRNLAASLFALAVSQGAAHADFPVVVSIKPIHSLVSAVMEGVGTPELIVKGAAAPHTYSLTPSQARALQNAKLVFWVGHELEAFLEKPIATLGAGAKHIELMDAHGLVRLDLREGGAFEEHDHDHGHDEHKHEGEHKEGEHKHDEHKHEAEHKDGEHKHEGHHGEEVDAHIWLDPENAKAIVQEVAEALVANDPKNAAAYEKNEQRLLADLNALIAEVRETVAPVRGKGFIVFHDAYQFFEKRFNILAAGSITVNPDTPSSVGRIREIKDKVRDLGAACVFSEPQFPPKIIRTVIEGTNAKTGVLDPLGAGLDDGPGLYFQLIRNMARSLRDCLSGGN
jgi:zinc transport system substrate-binding protein